MTSPLPKHESSLLTMLHSERGLSLVVVLIMVAVLLSIIGGGLLFSGLNLKTVAHKKTGDVALQVADYAIQHAVAAIPWGLEFDDLLSGTAAAFPCASPCNGTTNKPTLTGSLSGYSYTVVAMDDPADGSSSLTDDANQVVILRATASGPAGASRSVEAYVGRPVSTWRPRGAVYIGATGGTSGFAGSGFKISGLDTNPGGAEGSGPAGPIPGIAAADPTRKDNDIAALGSSKYGLVTGAGGSSPSILATNSFNVTKLATDLLTLYPADKITVCPGLYTNPTWGTAAAPKIIHIPPAPACPDGETVVTGGKGYGVMILERENSLNDLHIAGTFEWSGLILTRGSGGHVHFDPGHFGASGGAKVWGAVMTETHNTFDIGGSTKVYYSSQTINTIANSWQNAFPRPAAVLAWKELLS